MAEFILTGFGDEIDASLDRQIWASISSKPAALTAKTSQIIRRKRPGRFTPAWRIAASACPRSVRP